VRVSWPFAFVIMGVAVVIALVAYATAGCSSYNALAAYRTDELACVSKAATKAEADACRAVVEWRYCGDAGPLRDAGGCE
jgi:hypothetical protein